MTSLLVGFRIKAKHLDYLFFGIKLGAKVQSFDCSTRGVWGAPRRRSPSYGGCGLVLYLYLHTIIEQQQIENFGLVP